MRFESRVFWLPKDVDCPQFYEDAFAADAERGIAAIADGVSAAMFSGLWARILTAAAVARPPNLEDPEAFQAWLAARRTAWLEEIDFSRLTWFQREKMKQANGAASTLLWVTLDPDDDNGPSPVSRYRLRSVAIGDCCLFHVRQGQLLWSFPMQSADDFGLEPAQIGSVDMNQDHLLEHAAMEGQCLVDDLLVLCTDALAQWMLRQSATAEPVPWEKYWEITAEDWQDEIAVLRQTNQMRFDDTTLILLRVTEEMAAPIVEPAVLEELAEAALPAAATEPAVSAKSAEAADSADRLEPAEAEADQHAVEVVEEPPLPAENA
jgi:hypothetical protein